MVLSAGIRRSFIVAAVFAAGCGSGKPPAPAPGGASPGVESITGRERIGWNQTADSAAQLAGFRYAIYVDGARSELRGVTCSNTADAAGFSCSAALPAMSNGTHTLELAAFVMTGNGVLESPRTPGLRVSVAASTTPAAVEWPDAETETTADGLTLRAEKLFDGLHSPVDAAFAPDGTLFVVERSGTIKIFATGRTFATDALRTSGDEPAILLSLAVDPDYPRSHFVYVVAAAAAEAGVDLQVARYREVGGTLGERAVVFETSTTAEAAPAASAVVRFGPDGKLYLASGGRNADGMLMRLNADGTTPRDQAGSMPAIATGIDAARGLDWDPRTNMLWIADEGEAGSRLSAISLSSEPVRATVRGRLTLSGGIGSLSFGRSDAVPAMRGDAMLASSEGYVLRLRVAADEPARIEPIGRLFARAGQPVRVVAGAPDGAIYFCTDSALGRLSVQP